MPTNRDAAQEPTAPENDFAAEIAELRTIVHNLIEDRETLQAENDELTSRVAALENKPGGGGGVASAPIDRELGKLRRALEYVRDQGSPRMPLDAAEPLDPPAPEPADTKVDAGNGVSAGGTATN